MPTFASMKPKQYIITGINQLTQKREQLSRPMGEEEARQRLEREIANRKLQRYAAHKRLRIEVYDSVQLTFNFLPYDQE